ncbi:MAG TPA: hypothetical protein PLO51_03000, partial [Candidatus Micrarchaeota archaeon]|nr:hypothetical protein [Candidatus Micrarchaeota archaeon]
MNIPIINGIPLDASRRVDVKISSSCFTPGKKAREFDFYMLESQRKSPLDMLTSPKRKSCCALLPEFMAPIRSSSATGRLGYLQFEMTGARADISLYYPQDTASGICAGLGYYFEFIACNVLKSEGILEVSTQSNTTFERARQVGRVGLPMGVPVGIGEWIESMVRGIYLSKEYLEKLMAKHGAPAQPENKYAPVLPDKHSFKYAHVPGVLMHPDAGGRLV